MATKTTTEMVKWYYGTEAAYKAEPATFATGIYICTDNGKLYVHGTEVRDRNALTSVENYNVSAVSYNKSTRVLTVTQANGNTKSVTLPVVDGSAEGQGYGLVSGDFLGTLYASVYKNAEDIAGLKTAASNAATAAQTAQKTIDDFKATKGQANGIASLGADGKVPMDQIPGRAYELQDCYVTFTLNNDGSTTPTALYSDAGKKTQITPETNKLYVDNDTKRTFMYSGTTLAEVSPTLAIGTGVNNAYRGSDGAQLRTDVDQLRTDLSTQADGIPSQIMAEQGGGKMTVQLKAATLLGTATELPAATTTNNGVMSAADKQELAQLRTDLGQKADAASATGSAFARIAQNKADAATATQKANSAIKTIAGGVGGYGNAGMTIQTTTVGGTSATVTLPAAKGATDAQPSGQSGVMSGADKVLLDSVAAVVASTAYWYQATVQ